METNMINCIQVFFEKKKMKSIDTYKAYHHDITALVKDVFGHQDLDSLTKEEVESLKHDVLFGYFLKLSKLLDDSGERVYANTSLNRYQASIREFISYLSGTGAIEYNLDSFRFLDKFNDDSEEGEMIPLETVMQYVDYAKVFERKGVEKALLMKLAVETALRAQELLNLEWRQFIVEEDGVAIISKGKNRGKRNKEYLDKICHSFYNELLELKEIGNTQKLFTLKYRTVADMMKKLNVVFGNTDRRYTFHSFKRTAVTMVYLKTGCIVTAQNKARHKDINTTRRYLKIVDQKITGIISLMSENDENLYKTIEPSLLLKCIDKCRLDVKILLNNIIKEQLKHNNETH